MTFLRFCGAVTCAAATCSTLWGQTVPDVQEAIDSLYIDEIEQSAEPDKVLHAEPLFIDLIRDLGARKGEKEWNVGFGITDKADYDETTALVEYEWAPIDRLGLEVELPFSFHYKTSDGADTPGDKLEGLKLAAQYTFLVSQRHKTSLALGYIHELKLVEFGQYGDGSPYKSNVFNPFLVAAKRFGDNWHSLVYTGPQIERRNGSGAIDSRWDVNTNFHYMITGTRNFIGVELNKTFQRDDFDMTVRPQLRLGIADDLLIGIVAGVPVKRERERLSMFMRLIYEPGHRQGSKG